MFKEDDKVYILQDKIIKYEIMKINHNDFQNNHFE